MEGVPRLYMIGLPPKQCSYDQKPDFVSAISCQIQKSYGRDPSLYSDDIDALIGIRQSAIDAVMSTSLCTADDCSALKRYYAHLVRLTEKFPKLLQQQESCDQIKNKQVNDPTPPLTFTWKRTIGGKLNRPWKMKNDTRPAIVEQKKKSLWHTKDVDAAIAAFDSSDIGFEMRCVLYNLGAAHMRLAAGQNRSPSLYSSNKCTTEDEESPSNTALKIACTHLQCAAWAFEQLLGRGETSNKVVKWHHQQQPPVTNPIVLEFAYNVSLAQAQECILEKSMMDGRKSLIIAKVSAMISEYFAVAVDAVNRIKLEKYCVNFNRLEKWQLYSEFKCRYYGAVTALFQGQHVQDQLQQMGTRVSYYQKAVNLLGRAGQISEIGANTESLMRKEEDSADDEYYYYVDAKHLRHPKSRAVISIELEMRRDTISFALDVAAAKWRAAKSENELIYHEPVETVLSDEDDAECLKVKSSSTTTTTSKHSQLERIKGASLVKPVGFNVDDPELLAVIMNTSESSCSTITTLFRDLVSTDTRHQADTYRSEKCILEEHFSSLCQAADNKLTEFFGTLQLECLEMFKEDSGENSKDKKNNIVELPQQLVNCCAAYQALLEQKRQRKSETLIVDKEDQLDVNMARLSTAVQAVDVMLDEIDQLLKAEELGDSKYRRTVGRPYDYSVGRMRELRREVSRYREAHVGRARDSWVTLSQAVRDRRRRDLELLALPLDELAARLPPARPTRTAISAEVAAAGALTSSTPYNTFSCTEESPGENDDSEKKDGNGGHLRRLQQDSMDRLERLNVVVNKLHAVRNQRRSLLSQLKDDMDQEEKNSKVAGQDDAAILGELRGSDVDIKLVVLKKLDDQFGHLVNLIETNLSAQPNILDAVRTAYARASPERRTYANAIQRRRTLIVSLLDAYNQFVSTSKGMLLPASSETSIASPTSGPLPDAVLAERCTKGLDFYQRLQTNVSKLLQRVKGTCQVQTEQRDQIMKQYLQWTNVAQNSDEGLVAAPIDGLEKTNVSVVDDQDYHQKDLPDLVDNVDISDVLKELPEPLSDTEWDQHHNRRRLSPLGSEQQQQQKQQQKHPHSQMQPLPSASNIAAVGIDNYDSCHDVVKYETHAQLPQPVALPVKATNPAHPTAYNSHLGSTAGATKLINSITTSISSPLPSAPYKHYKFQFPTATSIVINRTHSPSSSNDDTDIVAYPIDNVSMEVAISAMIDAMHLTNSSNQNIVSSYSPSSGNNGGTIVFPNAAAALAALQQPSPAQYNGGGGSSIGNVDIGCGYHHQAQTTILPSQQQPFYPQQYKQQIMRATTITSGSSGGNTGVFLQQQQLQLHQQQQQFIMGSGSMSGSVQSPLTLSPSISTVNVNNGSITAIAAHSSSITTVPGVSTATNFFHQPMILHQQQQQIQLYQQQQQIQLNQQQQQQQFQLNQQQIHLNQQQLQFYQQLEEQLPELYQQQPEFYQQQPEFYQQPELYQQQSELYQQQTSQRYREHHDQQQIHQLLSSTVGSNSIGNFYYSMHQQQEQEPQQYLTQTSQQYRPSQPRQQGQVQLGASLRRTSAVTEMSLSNSGGSCYYEQLQQYTPRAMEAPTATAPLNTTATSINSYYNQQPSMEMMYNQEQQPQYYQQQPPVAPVMNLLDDDLVLSGPSPIQPKKIGGNGGSDAATN